MYFHPAITAAACVLFVSTVYALFRCAFTEPGIIPRNTRYCHPAHALHRRRDGG